jgi:hypothetical protein
MLTQSSANGSICTYASTALVFGLERRDAEDERRNDATEQWRQPVDPHVVGVLPEGLGTLLAQIRKRIDNHWTGSNGWVEDTAADCMPYNSTTVR